MAAELFDIAIIGAGMAGASLAAAIGTGARTVLIEGEGQPGYHATGRSAAFWSETYGGPGIQPLTTASAVALTPYLGARGCLHIADDQGEAALDVLEQTFTGRPPFLVPVDRAGLLDRLPGLGAQFRRGLWEASCADIDVARLHADQLALARAGGARLMADARLLGAVRDGEGWRIETTGGTVRARVLVDAAGAWASEVARLAGASAIAIAPYRRTVVQLAVEPPPAPDMPLVIDALGRFYWKPEPGGRLWLSPHDETPLPPQDVAPEELDVAIAIDRLEGATEWRVLRRERAWAGLRSFAPDRLPVYGFDDRAPGFFWFAGQGGFGIQTAPAAAMIGAALLLGEAMPEPVRHIDVERYGPGRFG